MQDEVERIAARRTGCTMGIGCDDYGVCYAEAHGRPEKCPRTPTGADPMTQAQDARYGKVHADGSRSGGQPPSPAGDPMTPSQDAREAAEEAVSAANIVSHDGYYEVDIDAVTAVFARFEAHLRSTSPAGEAGEMVERLLQIRGTQFTPTENALVTEAAAMLERLAASDTEARVEALGEALHGLSARLLLSGAYEDDATHAAYEKVVERFSALAKGGAA